MIVISKSEAIKFGKKPAPVGIYVPIEIKGNLWVLPDACEGLVEGEKRKILDNEWILNN